MKAPLSLVAIRRSVRSSPGFAALVWLALALPALATSLQLDFTVPSSFNESNRQALLEWNAAPARTYLVQSATNLSPETVWKTEAPVRASEVGPIKWMAPEVIRERKFYRLILPQPEVFSVEPSFVNSDDPGALLYLSGQMLPTNGSVVINGQNFSVTSFDTNGSWIAISLNGLPPGTPVIGSILVLDNGSNIVTTLPLQNPVIYGTELTAEQLQGPPDEPPASPQALLGAWLSKKGYDYYKAQSDLNAAGLQTNPHFVGNNTAGAMPETRGSLHRGHVTVLKSHADDDDDDDGVDGDLAKGKKGLNAVNVKLARVVPRTQRAYTGSDLRLAGGGGLAGGVIAAIVVAARSSGELLCEETDLAIPGRGMDFAWTRTYRSRAETTTAQGAGWDFSYNVSATAQPDGTVVLRLGNGRADTFYPNGTNGWTRDEYFLVIHDVDQDGAPDTVVFPDTGKWLLHPPGTSFAGKLAEIMDRNTNTIRCEYDTDTGRLLRVVDTLDRTNTVAYTSKGLIESVTDFSGRTVRYEYDSAADLIACISPAVIGTPNGNDFPGGKTNRYAYSTGNLDERLNHNLVSITDPKGQVCLEVTYQATNNPASLDFDAVSSVQRGVDKKDIRRGMVIARPSNSFATVQTIVNDYVGNVTEYLFDSRQRCVSVREFTGRANPALPTTATENRPTGKLRAEDPDYFETRWEWNADSLCTLEIRPDGGSTEVSHQRAQDHNSTRSNKTASRAHDGNVRVVRERAAAGGGGDLDGDGLNDIAELAWYFEYDPRFGSPGLDAAGARYKHRGWDGLIYGNHRTAFSGDNTPIIKGSALGGLDGSSVATLRHKYKGWDGLIYGNHRTRPKGWDGTIKGVVAESAKIVTDRDTGRSKGFAFVTSTVDPRGNSVTGSYDDRGNLVEKRRRGEVKNLGSSGNDGVEVKRELAYNPHGQLTALTNAADGDGFRRVDTFTYHTNSPQSGYLQSSVVDAGGLALTESYEYDARGNLTRLEDPRGNDTVFTYNALDQLVHAETPPNSTYPIINWDVSLIYDANNNLIRCDEGNRDETGAPGATNPHWTTLFEHDALDRLTGIVREISEGGGLPGQYATNRFFYDGNDNLVAVHSPLAVAGSEPNNIVTNLYDERDLLFCRITAPGTAIAENKDVELDFNGNVTRILQTPDSGSAKIAVATYTYDGFDRLVSVRDAMGNEQQFTYDRNSNLICIRTSGELNDVIGTNSNVRLAETRYEYDFLNRVTRSVDSFFDVFTQAPLTDGESVTAFTYAPNGQILTVTDDNAQATRYTYDTVGRLATTTDAKTNIVSYTYDECANVLSVVQTDRSDLGGNQQFATVYGYDRLHRLTRSADNVGNTNLYAYDSRGNLVRHTDPRGNDVCYDYDGLSRETGSISYVGPCDASPAGITISTTHVEYNDNDRVTAATDSNGNTTFYSYDARDRCVLVTQADGTHSSLVWSPRSNLLRHQDANGTVITNIYDLLDRCVARVITPGPTVAPTTTFETFTYDGFSRVVAASNDVSGNTFAYDSLGNHVRTTQDGLTTTATFDAVGNKLSQTYPGGRVVTYTYDALNQPTSLSSSAGGGLPSTVLAQLAYDGDGRLGRLARANNVNTRYQWNGLVSPPNAAEDFGWMQVRSINHQTAGNGPIVDRRIAAYDRSQNRTQRAQIAPFVQGGNMLTNTFGYDALDRLRLAIKTKGTSAQRVDYSLDGNGNRLEVAVDLVPELYTMDNTFPDPADFQMNQYTVTPFGAQEYDENGNLLARINAFGPTFYQYDCADRLVQVDGINGEGFLGPIVSFSYDALGRRISKTIFPNGLPPVITQFIYDGDAIIEERDNGTLKRTYVFPHVLDQKGRITFTDTGETFYSHDDDLGNALALTDASGAVVERYDYDDYGNPFFLTADGLPTGEAASGVGNPYGWRGLRLDAETGLYSDDGGSYFDPHTARDIGLLKLKYKISKESHGKFRVANNPWSSGSPVGMKKGTVKFFNDAKGFGFVADGGVNVKLIVPIAMDKGLRFGVRGSTSGTRAQDHNSVRSNKTASIACAGGSVISAAVSRYTPCSCGACRRRTGHVSLLK